MLGGRCRAFSSFCSRVARPHRISLAIRYHGVPRGQVLSRNGAHPSPSTRSTTARCLLWYTVRNSAYRRAIRFRADRNTAWWKGYSLRKY